MKKEIIIVWGRKFLGWDIYGGNGGKIFPSTFLFFHTKILKFSPNKKSKVSYLLCNNIRI